MDKLNFRCKYYMKIRQESFLHSIGFGIFWRLLSKLAGLVKHIVIAGAIGLSTQLDIFYMAMAVLGILVFSWSGVLEIVAVPRLIKFYRNKQFLAFKKLAGGLFWFAFIWSLVLAIITLVMPDYLAKIAIGFDANRTQELSSAFYWLMPVVLLAVPLSLMNGIMLATRQFSHNNQSYFLSVFVIVICVLFWTTEANVLLWSYSLSVIITFIYLLFFSRNHIQFNASPISDEVQNCLRFSWGLLVLQSATYVYTISDRIFISFLETGAISALSYGVMLILLAPIILSLDKSFIAVLAEKQSQVQKTNILNNAMSLCIYIAVPTSVIFLNFRIEIVQLLLERGSFNHQNTLTVSTIILGYIWSLLPLFLLPVLHQVFQVEKRIRMMINLVIIGIISNIIFNGLFLFYFKLGAFGIALATSISYWIMFIFSLKAMQKIGYNITWFAHLRWGLWLLIIFSFIPLLEYLNPFNISILTELIIIAILSVALMLIGGLLSPLNNEKQLIKNNLDKILSKIK